MSSDNAGMKSQVFVALVSLNLFLAMPAQAQEIDFLTSPLWLSVSSTTEGQPVRVSAVVTKQNDIDVQGEVTFFAAGTKIGASGFALSSSETGTVISISWTPSAGTYPITAQITRAVASKSEAMLSVPKELRATRALEVLKDTDRDLIEDIKDDDDDNDGVSDTEELKQGSDPLIKETKAVSAVLGTSTASSSSDALISRALETASDVGGSVFEVTEEMRVAADAYVAQKVKDIEARRAATSSDRTSSTTNSDSPATVLQVRSLQEQLGDINTIKDITLLYGLKVAQYIVGNVYIFYLAGIFMVLFIVRRIWKRHSLDG